MLMFASLAYCVPFTLVVFAWRHKQIAGLPTWRRHVALAAFGFAGAAIALDFAFTISWLHNGGSPHGLDPSPGFWSSIGPVLKWVFFGSLFLSLFGKRKERVFLYLSVISAFIAGSLVNILQMD
jgi:hypothetical protein